MTDYSCDYGANVTHYFVIGGQDDEENARDNLRTSIQKHATLDATKMWIAPSLSACETKLLESNKDLSPAAAHILMQRAAVSHESGRGYVFSRDVRLRYPPGLRLTESMVNSFVRHVCCDVMLIAAGILYSTLIMTCHAYSHRQRTLKSR